MCVRVLTLVVLARGATPVRSCCSISTERTPRIPSSIAAARPAGPAPTMSTSVSNSSALSSKFAIAILYGVRMVQHPQGCRPPSDHIARPLAPPDGHSPPPAHKRPPPPHTVSPQTLPPPPPH